ncbi:MAG: MATE family efflux transporter [Bacillota bacterium]
MNPFFAKPQSTSDVGLKRAKTARLRREIFVLAWPAIMEMLLQTMVWNVDTAFMGRVGAEAVAAVGVGGMVYWTVLWAFGGLGAGVTAMVARAVGAGRPDAARAAASQALRLAFACGLAVSAAALVGGPRIVALTSLPESTRQLAVLYLRTLALGAPIYLPAIIAFSVIRSTGDTRTPMVITGLINLLNIVLAWFLVFGHGGLRPMGLAGSAIAAVTSQVLGAVVALTWLFASPRGIGLRPSHLFARGGSASELVRLSVPSGFESLLMDGARTMGTFFLTTLGSAAAAASYVAANAEAISYMPGYGFAVAAGILAGQKLGAGDEEGAREAVRQSLLIGMSIMGAFGLIFIAFPSVFVRIFTAEAGVVLMASQCLRVTGFAQPFMATTDILCGSLRGAGDTKTPLLITLGGAWALRVPLTFIFIVLLHLPVYYAWVAMLIEWSVRAFISIRVFRTGKWLKTRVRLDGSSAEPAGIADAAGKA